VSGQNQVVTTFFPTIGGSKCKNERIGITMTEEKWNQSLSDQESTYFKNLESKILMAIWNAYGQKTVKELYRVSIEEFRPGSVVAIMQLLFENSTIDPLQPLQEEMSDGSLASIKVNPVLDVDPSILSTATSMCKQSINCCLLLG